MGKPVAFAAIFLSLLGVTVCAYSGFRRSAQPPQPPSCATALAPSVQPTTQVRATAPATATAPASTPPSRTARHAAGLHHPAPGSAERKEILDDLRPTIERDLGQKVLFRVKTLSVQEGFAFLEVAALTPSGIPIDYSKTHYRKQMDEGVFDNTDAPVIALMRYSKGAWRVATFVIAPTDVAYAGWWQKYGAPRSLFPYSE